MTGEWLLYRISSPTDIRTCTKQYPYLTSDDLKTDWLYICIRLDIHVCQSSRAFRMLYAMASSYEIRIVPRQPSKK